MLKLKNTGATPAKLKNVSIWDEDKEVIAKKFEPAVTIEVNGVSEPIEVGPWPDEKVVGPQKQYSIKIETESGPLPVLQNAISDEKS